MGAKNSSLCSSYSFITGLLLFWDHLSWERVIFTALFLRPLWNEPDIPQAYFSQEVAAGIVEEGFGISGPGFRLQLCHSGLWLLENP